MKKPKWLVIYISKWILHILLHKPVYDTCNIFEISSELSETFEIVIHFFCVLWKKLVESFKLYELALNLMFFYMWNSSMCVIALSPRCRIACFHVPYSCSCVFTASPATVKQHSAVSLKLWSIMCAFFKITLAIRMLRKVQVLFKRYRYINIY